MFAGFDGLRAIAALLVVVVHTSFHTGDAYDPGIGPFFARAEMGVAVFFVISGFLLYRPFAVAHLDAAAVPNAGTFLVRRFLRIYPAYWLALVVGVLVVDEKIYVNGWAGLIRCALLVQGFQPLWSLQGLTQSWTLTVEVAFYLSLPLYAWLLGRLSRRAAGARARLRTELVGLGLLFLLGKLVHRLLIPTDVSWALGWNTWLPVWWDLFSLGMALAVVSAYYARLGRGPRWADLPGSGTACWLVAAGFYWVATTRIGLPVAPLYTVTVRTDMGRHLFYGLFAVFLVLPAVFGAMGRGWVRPLLASRPMALLGLVSYGIYLWHVTVLEMLRQWTDWDIWNVPSVPYLMLVIAITAALATVSYNLVERPAIFLGRWLTRRRSSRAAASRAPVPVPAAASLSVLSATSVPGVGSVPAVRATDAGTLDVGSRNAAAT